MLTFLEFHQSLLGFVNYKLYADINMMYPPQLDARLEESGAGLLSSYVMRPVEELALVGAADEAMVAAVDTADKKRQKVLRKEAIQKLKTLNEKLADLDSEEASAIDADMDGMDADINNDADSCARASTSLFSNVVVFLSREVPRYSLEFVLRAFGATVCYPETSGLGSPYDESAPEITHQIVDRPEVNVVPGRVYVQPQWVYDSINRGELVKETDYGVGKLLPPHLSPFVTYREGDYVPEQDQHEDAVNGEMDDVMEESVDVASATASKTTTTDSVIIAKAKQMLGSGEATEAHVEQLELEAEAAGIPYSEFAATTTTKTTMTTRSITASTGTAIEPAQLVKQRQQQKQEQQRKREEQERRELAKMVMSNKQRKLLDCIDKGKAKRLAEADTLRAKKQAATKSKAVARK